MDELENAAHFFTPMTLSDLPEVMAIEQAVYPFPWSQGNFADSISAGYWGTCLRDADGQLLGYSLVMPVLDEAHLLNVAVANKVQRKGFGRMLLEMLCIQAKAEQMTSVLLEVRPSNTHALRTYEQYGFTHIGRRKGYYPQSEVGGVEDAIVMRLHLNPTQETV